MAPEVVWSGDHRTNSYADLCTITAMRILFAVFCVVGPSAAMAESKPVPESFEALGRDFRKSVRPLMQRYCLGCHSTSKKEGELDLERFHTIEDVRRDARAWQGVVPMLQKRDMPPTDARQPTDLERKRLLNWVRRYLYAEALARAGDPGPIVLRRLSNAEYTHTVRDLTGVPLDPAAEFPGDNAAGEGFTNTGGGQAMSPALLVKYLDAAKSIAGHAVLLPDGMRFSARNSSRDWTDEKLAEIRAFYRGFTRSEDLGVGDRVGNLNVHANTRLGVAGRLPVKLYLLATLEERDRISRGQTTLADVARTRKLSDPYLETLWKALHQRDPSLLLSNLQKAWQNAEPGDVDKLVAGVLGWQQALWKFGPVGLVGRKGAPRLWMSDHDPVVVSQELTRVLPESKPKGEPADGVLVVLSVVIGDTGDGHAGDIVLLKSPRLVKKGQDDLLLKDVLVRGPQNEQGITGQWLSASEFGRHPKAKRLKTPIPADSLCVQGPTVVTMALPAARVAGRTLVTTALLEPETGQGGSVQVELVNGRAKPIVGLQLTKVTTKYSQVTRLFSDTQVTTYQHPVLVAAKPGKSDDMGKSSRSDSRSPGDMRWRHAFAEFRQLFPMALCYTQIVPVDEVLTMTLFHREDHHLKRLMLTEGERRRLDRLWEELRFVSDWPLKKVTAMELLLEVMEGVNHPQYDALLPIRDLTLAEAEAYRKDRRKSEASHVAAVLRLAARAYRRPLEPGDRVQLEGLYRSLRDEGLSHDAAIRMTIARVFVAAAFLYRLEQVPDSDRPEPVSGLELATRLSYFLWSSSPDSRLSRLAESGTLRDDKVLLAEVRRMLRDGRVRRLATEFGCQWLHVHDFPTRTLKSASSYPEFDGLKVSMYEEPIRFLADLFARDGSLLEVLDADHTIVDGKLADFYGVKDAYNRQRALQKTPGDWIRLSGMRAVGRGGMLGWASTLAAPSGAARTSPILRGNWVSEVLLGEKLPRPPKQVPQLPADESATEGLTVRELVSRHSTDESCAKCHRRIDPFGFALESFDTIGRRRTKDAGGRPVMTRVRLPDGTQIKGLDGLRDYLKTKRRGDFVSQFNRKLLGYALGREVRLSDQPLLEEIDGRMSGNDYRVSVAIEMIVMSPQFRRIRGAQAP